MVFSIVKDGQPVSFFGSCGVTGNTNTSTPATFQMINGFTGGPSVYFTWAYAQDGIQQPADFNARANKSLTDLCYLLNGPSSAGNLADNGDGSYTAQLTGTNLPPGKIMLTGFLGAGGFTQLSVPNANNVNQYPYGLIVMPQMVSMPADPNNARRAIVASDVCNKCHEALDIFHSAARNDATSCIMCHNPNLTSSAWSGNTKNYIHALHAGGFRNTPFTWHGSSLGTITAGTITSGTQTVGGVTTTCTVAAPCTCTATNTCTAYSTYADVTFPSRLNDCEACHLKGTYDFSNAASAAALPYMFPTTVATGIPSATSFTVSPYVLKDGTSYGSGYAYSGNLTRNVTSGSAIAGKQGATTCTATAPCTTCTTTAPCVGVNLWATTTSGTSTAGTQNAGATTCTATAPCTCTAASPCTNANIACTTTAPCEAESVSLVTTPITTACSACHDSSSAIAHMVANGGEFYAARSKVLADTAAFAGESCLVCHGTDGAFPIADVHR
jgi:OmcA/MtrC family decaheme c-type cytochrome